nr:hypothetical protein [Tanacetum cinerariifolium]
RQGFHERAEPERAGNRDRLPGAGAEGCGGRPALPVRAPWLFRRGSRGFGAGQAGVQSGDYLEG